MSVEENRLVLHGSSSNVTIDLPASADGSRTTRHWALVTETFLEDGRRSVTFTHSESLDEFTIQLPAGSGTVRYGGFEGRDGPEVLVLAWGEESAVYWGWLTIAKATGAAAR